MSRTAVSIPAETDILCERCGYVLNGLPNDSRCPECGTPIVESGTQTRQPPAWEQSVDAGPAVTRFFHTLYEVIIRPARFYRNLDTRSESPRALAFARILWWVVSVLFGLIAYVHFNFYMSQGSAHRANLVIWPIMTVVVYAFLSGVTRLAAKLSAWEGAYRGLRLPYEAVLRGMYYHAAHYIPVTLISGATVLGYCPFATLDHPRLAELSLMYLYVLSGEVVVGAFYLFHTYWIGMRNMMYANR